ncbi:MAG: prepilin-type N-terminal cleavage/methylation domain-containing protein, partial [Eubacterium sp.]|nr:prepilin-type N-terminal cleavage/methylation domain-containing protein [Eubacterium sp.]
MREEKNLNKNSKKKGFTLVELIVVLVILVILASIAIPLLLGYIDNARQKRLIADANAALKSSQTVITEVYNESGNLLDSSRRYKAWNMTGIDNATVYEDGKGYSKFRVWTGKPLVTNATEPIADNIASYTVKYAVYEVPSKDGTYALFYDGKEWTVYDTLEELEDSSKYVVSDGASSGIIYMWPNYPSCDTAMGEINVAEKDWYERDEQEPTEVTVTLHGFQHSKDSLSFISGDVKEYSIDVTFTREDERVTNTWEEANKVKVGSSYYDITADGNYIFLDKWSVADPMKQGYEADAPNNNLVWGPGEDGKVGIFSDTIIAMIFNKEITELYAVGYRDYEE